MTPETKWRIVWGTWLAVGVAAEAVAITSKHEHAPLSHHLRQSTHRLGKTSAGQIALLAFAQWLHRHLYSEVPQAISKNGGQAKSPRK